MKELRRAARGMARILRTRYPRFILGMPLGRAEIPVFNYHDVQEPEFAGDLEFLKRNGYRTLALDEFVQARARGVQDRCVLLTFDDARRSFSDVALPVLRRYRARAALFVPTWWMRGDSREGPIGARELFMSWNDVRACRDSGLVDVQSHAHRHALVHTADELVDFATPATLGHYDVYDWPMRNGAGGDELGPPLSGTPVYRAAPLLSAPQRYLESSELAAACREFAAQQGGDAFFAEPGWARRLRAFHAARAASCQGRLMAEAAFAKLVASEFDESREAFRAELGYAPTYFAFPWMLGAPGSLELAKRAGMRAAFGVALDYRAERARGLPIPVYGRLKCDWIRFLPGEGRASVMGALGRKFAQFSKIQHLAH